MVRLLFGGKTPITGLSIKEIGERLPYVVRDLKVQINRYWSITDPALRIAVEKEILVNFFKLQDYSSKFKKSFLDRINRNGRYFFKLLSNMKLEELVRRWPNPGVMINDMKKQFKTNIKIFRQQEHDEIQKSYGLRGYASDIENKFYSNMSSTVRSINKKVNAVKKQRDNQIRQQEINAEKQQQVETSRNRQTALRPRNA